MNDNNQQNITVLVSPFFPFNRILSNEIVNKIFTEHPPASILYLDYEKHTGLDDFIEEISELTENSPNPIYLLSFGIFSFVAGEIIKKIGEKLVGVLFIEPDFSGSLLKREYKENVFKNKIRNQLICFYTERKQIGKKYRSKEDSSGFLFYLSSLQTSNNLVRLADFIEKNPNISIIWNMMEKDSWPLPQILTEHYHINVFKITDHIVAYTQKNQRIVVENFQ